MHYLRLVQFWIRCARSSGVSVQLPTGNGRRRRCDIRNEAYVRTIVRFIVASWFRPNAFGYRPVNEYEAKLCYACLNFSLLVIGGYLIYAILQGNRNELRGMNNHTQTSLMHRRIRARPNSWSRPSQRRQDVVTLHA